MLEISDSEQLAKNLNKMLKILVKAQKLGKLIKMLKTCSNAKKI